VLYCLSDRADVQAPPGIPTDLPVPSGVGLPANPFSGLGCDPAALATTAGLTTNG
jgi:hypothetical protein